MKQITYTLARELKVVGLMNVNMQPETAGFRLRSEPRASRTIPFVSKATGVPYARLASQVMAGRKLREIGTEEVKIDYFAVKAVFPFRRFPG